jgi:hypothetical protein
MKRPSNVLSLKDKDLSSPTMRYARFFCSADMVKEYDALPGVGQACGHNLIAISSIGAALATKAWLEEDSNRKGTIKLFGTPVVILYVHDLIN